MQARGWLAALFVLSVKVDCAHAVMIELQLAESERACRKLSDPPVCDDAGCVELAVGWSQGLIAMLHAQPVARPSIACLQVEQYGPRMCWGATLSHVQPSADLSQGSAEAF